MKDVLLLSVIVVLVTLAVFGIARDHRYAEACETQGGVVIKSAGRSTCAQITRITP